MADVNSNKNQAYTGGPSVQSTGEVAQTNQPDNQKGPAANATGQTTYERQAIGGAPDVNQSGGPQPSDPVQSMQPVSAEEEE